MSHPPNKETTVVNIWISREVANMDLKLILMVAEPVERDRHKLFSTLSSYQGRASYYKAHYTGRGDIAPCSDRLLSEYFLDAYHGDYRRAYLTSTFPGMSLPHPSVYCTLVE